MLHLAIVTMLGIVAYTCNCAQFCLDMADNESECVMTDIQIKITTIVYASVSFLSFIAGLVSLILDQCHHHRYKNKYQFDPMGRMCLFALAVLSTFELFESFQWILLFHDVGCTVLGAIREYILISLLTTVAFFGIHLLIVMTQPKCLQVIQEEKQKKYKMLQRIYFITSLSVPVLFVPWPFITIKYGEDEYVCWFADTDRCNTSGVAVVEIVTRLLMWHFLAVLLWLFSAVVVIYAFCQYCLHKSVSNESKSTPNENVTALVSLLIVFILSVVANGLLFLWELVTHKSSFPLALLAAVVTPLMLIIYTLIVNIRKVCIIRARHVNNFFESNATNGRTYGATNTNFTLPDDEWD